MSQNKDRCIIWDTPATITKNINHGNDITVFSPRAGGLYRVVGPAFLKLIEFSKEDRLRITQFVIQNNYIDSIPTITKTTIEEIRRTRLPTMLERADWLLRHLIKRTLHIGYEISFPIELLMHGNKEDAGMSLSFGSETDSIKQLLAWSASNRDAEANYLLKYLEKKGYIEFNSNADFPDLIVLPQGFAHISDLESQAVISDQAFVAMWFGPDMDRPYEHGFEKAIRISGYQPVRIDRKEHINKIDDEIIAEIRRSRFLVADFTCEPDKPRGGVYFEAGFAMGHGIPVIWTCRQDLIDHVHFDTRQFNHIVWSDASDLQVKLRNRIGAVIGDGPLSDI